MEKKKQLEEKTKELENLLHLEREYSDILSVLRSVYDQIFTIDLEKDTYHMIQADGERELLYKNEENARETFYRIAQKFVMESYKQMIYEFLIISGTEA